MLKKLTRQITLAVQVRTGASSAVFVWAAVMLFGALICFVFLCVSLYQWLSLHFGSVFGGLAAAAIFMVFAALGGVLAVLAQRRARERAILERAAQMPARMWVLDPKILSAGVQLGRTLGWQRVVPIALLGFLAAQWAREHRLAAKIGKVESANNLRRETDLGSRLRDPDRGVFNAQSIGGASPSASAPGWGDNHPRRPRNCPRNRRLWQTLQGTRQKFCPSSFVVADRRSG